MSRGGSSFEFAVQVGDLLADSTNPDIRTSAPHLERFTENEQRPSAHPPYAGAAVVALMLDPATVPPVPWRNGAGSTRELAVAGETFEAAEWRISVATLDKDAPFSLFPGMDRLFVALGPLRLSIEGVVTAKRFGDQVRFAGEDTVAVEVDAPSSALNVMTARGRWRAEVKLRKPGANAAPGVDASVRLGGAVADVSFYPLTVKFA